MPKWFTAFHCLLCLVLLAACAPSPELRRLGPGATVLAFGDSLTYGTGTSRESSYPAELARLTGLKVYNAGVPGEVSADGLKRLPAILDDTLPDLVVLCHGGNDILRRQDLGEAAANLGEMIRLVRAHGAEVVLLGVPEPGLFLQAADFYQQVADAQRVAADLDTIPSLLKQKPLKSDTVHFNAEGYARLAAAVQDLLRKHGALP